MFLAFHLPYEVRNSPDVYRWVVYKAMHHIGSPDLAVAGHPALFSPVEPLAAANDFAVDPGVTAYFRYEPPTTQKLQSYPCYPIDPAIFAPLEAELKGPTLTWRALLTRPYAPLVAAVREIVRELGRKTRLEGILLWANCPSVVQVAREYGLPVIHNEVGPLRPPRYHMTGYFDLSGVNGGTEAQRRFEDAQSAMSGRELLSTPQLWGLLTQGADAPPIPDARRYKLGVALQVPDDSNLIAYGSGFTNDELVRYAQRRAADNEILVRPHPAAPHPPYVKGPRLDDSPSSLDFLRRVERLISINSSVCLEAAMSGVPADIIGDSPYAAYPAIMDAHGAESKAMREWLHFIVLGYLVPWSLMFDLDYIRFRLTYPPEHEIEAWHWRAWMAQR